jgi:alpha-L-glutamate ligase-like protein
MINWFGITKRLRALGVVGMNARNVGGVLNYNHRSLFPVVDDKLQMLQLCERIGIPTPTTYAVFTRHGDLRHLNESLEAAPDCVIKPARGAAGRGIVVLTGKADDGFRKHNGTTLRRDELRQHLSDMLSGLYSLGGRPDRALLQQRVLTHPAFERISYRGTPDLRVLLYRGFPALAMLRLPTMESNGCANLHQGGVGVGVDMESGQTTHAIYHNRRVERHPDTGDVLAGRAIPQWEAILQLSRTIARATGLGYLGVDVVLEAERGPLLLEANARPGLAIQSANGIGLRHIFAKIDQTLERK